MKTVDFSTIKGNPFFWFYFLCSFPEAFDPETDISISDFIQENYCSKASFEWWNSFVQYYDGVLDENDGYVEDPTTIVIPAGDNEYSLQFHPGDTEYYRNDEKIGCTGPHYMVRALKYSDFAEITSSVDDPLKAFLLLPLVGIEETETEQIVKFIYKVLQMLPVQPVHYMNIIKMLVYGMKDHEKKTFEINSPEDIVELILSGGIIEVPPYESERQGNSLYIPKFDMLLIPSVQQMTENSVVIEFNMYIKKLEKRLYECCVGMGKDIKSAVGMAIGSFILSFINSLDYMFEKNDPRKITTEYEDKKHYWNAYIGNIIGMGESDEDPESGSERVYWDLLEEDIRNRLGDQKMAYVKIYTAKYPGDVIGEVRIDNVEIPELGEKVKSVAEKWDVQQFRSEKQFIFIEQDS